MFEVHGKCARILRAADHEAALRPPPRRLHEEPLQRRLPILGIGAEIGERRREARIRRRRMVQRRIDRAVERRHAARTQLVAQGVERAAAGVGEHEVEAAEPLRPHIADRLPGREPRQGHRRVEIVEAAHGGAAAHHQFRRRQRIRAVGSDHARIRLGQRTARARQRLGPIGIEHQLAAFRQRVQVAVQGVVVDVALEEGDAVAVGEERRDQRAPQRRVPVAPGRADGKPEDDQPHAASKPPAGAGMPRPW